MAEFTFKILRCENRKIFKVCLAIFQHYKRKGQKVFACFSNHYQSLIILHFTLLTLLPLTPLLSLERPLQLFQLLLNYQVTKLLLQFGIWLFFGPLL